MKIRAFLMSFMAATSMAPSGASALGSTELPPGYHVRKSNLPCDDLSKGCTDSRHIMWCTDEELKQFPDLYTSTPEKPGPSPKFSGLPGLWPGAASVPKCQEVVYVEDEYAPDAGLDTIRSGILGKHPGSKKVTWYYGVHTGGIWKCPYHGVWPMEIYYGGGNTDVVVVPTPPTPPVVPKAFTPSTASTGPGFSGVGSGRMHDGAAGATSRNGSRGMAEISAESFCRRGNRSKDVVEKCLKLIR